MNALSMLRQRPHVSVSQIKTYLQCPRKHALQYIDKTAPDFRPIALVFGTAWHAAVEEYLLRKATTKQAAEIFRGVLEQQVDGAGPPVLFEDEEDLGQCLSLGSRMLEVFTSSVPRPEQVLGTEVAFSLELADFDGHSLDRPLIGAIDALVVEGGRPVIWEFKTGKKKWSADQLEFDLQPTAYKMGARVHDLQDPVLQIIVTTKAKSPGVQVERVTRTARDEQELVEVIASVLRAIEAGIDHPMRGWQCRSCPFASSCR